MLNKLDYARTEINAADCLYVDIMKREIDLIWYLKIRKLRKFRHITTPLLKSIINN